jgi:hypothetical protein
MSGFRDDFEGQTLDLAVWDPHYLPQWSSRAATAATYAVSDSRLRLWIPPEQALWCPDLHPDPLRVSGIASGAHSGPVGSAVGGQPFIEGQTVREQQPRLEGWLPSGGAVAVKCRMELSHRSMAAVWLSGFEETPEQSGEVCLVEIFGKDVVSGESAEVGMGINKFRDPGVVHDFAAPRVALDVTDWHEYAVRWHAGGAEFRVDGTVMRTCASAPAYPLQVMIAVFDFPGWSRGDDDRLVPSLLVDWVKGSE